MSNVSPATQASTRPFFCPSRWLVPHLTPYNITVAVVLGVATAGFGALVTVLIIIATNCNVLGLVE